MENNDKYPHEEITRAILGCAFDVINGLGAGFLESVYEKAMVIALKEKGLSVQSQYPVQVYFHGQCVGDFYPDLLVEEKVIVELKAVRTISPEHQAQVINYLHATGLDVALLINFGNSRLEYKRLSRGEIRKVSEKNDIQW